MNKKRQSCDFMYNKNMLEYELVKHDKMKGLRVFLNSIRMRSSHTHHDIELIYILKGEGTIVIKNKHHFVQQGDAILINAFESHEILSSYEAITVIIIQFSNHFLKDYFHHLKNAVFHEVMLKKCLSKEDYQLLIENILSLSKSYIEADKLFELICIQKLSNILYLLFQHLEIEELSDLEYSRRKKTNQRINRISTYIDENYMDQIRLQDIAEQEKITITHLSHIIKENFGMSFQEYVKDKRLECAIRLIEDSSLSLSEISQMSGFSELKYMTKAFKDAFHVSPKEYRSKEYPSPIPNKKANLFEYIYSKEESLYLLNRIEQLS